MSYTPFTPNIVDLLHIQGINSDPYVYDTNRFSLIEQVGILFERLNQTMSLLNLTQTEVLQFENYMIEQLQHYNELVQEDVTNTLNELITDGTIGNLINQTLLTQINTNITNLTTTVTQNKTSSDTQFAQINQEITDLNYKEPSLVLSSSPSNTLYNIGENINSIILNFNITIGTNSLVKAEIYKNNSLLSTVNNPISGSNTYTDANITNSDTDYYIKLYDNKGNVSSNHITYNFVSNYFYGVASNSDVINSSFIASLQSLKARKSNQEKTFTCNNNKVIFSYPTPYGNLIEINYKNNNIIDSFTLSTVTINSITYNVYVSNQFIYDTLTLDFNVEV